MTAATLERQLAEVLTFYDDAEAPWLELTVRSLPPVEYARLVDEHPPGADESPHGPWSPRRFPPALIAACTGLEHERAVELWEGDELGVDESHDLLDTCLRLAAPGEIDWAADRLRRDPRLVLELDYCSTAGIAHSSFLAWPRRDRDLAIAHLIGRRARCPGCGIPEADMGDPLAGDVETVTCVHCELKTEIERTIPDEERARVHVYVVPIPAGRREA